MEVKESILQSFCCNLALNLNRRLDKIITDVNFISLNDLMGLKEGIGGAPQELVAILKKLLKYVASEAEIANSWD